MSGRSDSCRPLLAYRRHAATPTTSSSIGPDGRRARAPSGRQLAAAAGPRVRRQPTHEIEARTGVDIPYIFEHRGRGRLPRPRGGGDRRADAATATWCWPPAAARCCDADNRAAAARAAARVVYLRPTVDQQLAAHPAQTATGRCCRPPTRAAHSSD
ncbi:MAG: hypothetical protein MZV65_54105 [Chromatiales bacterium]|nr:hypothetical protein [Chromatiales bacterium]